MLLSRFIWCSVVSNYRANWCAACKKGQQLTCDILPCEVCLICPQLSTFRRVESKRTRPQVHIRRQHEASQRLFGFPPKLSNTQLFLRGFRFCKL